MTLEEFEQKFEAQAETQNVDFKADMPWIPNDFAKDVLAMTNLRDGGAIIVGVSESDRGFVKQGVSTANLKTYKIDEMRDQLLKFADPAVDIHMQVLESSGKNFVVINVRPFKDLPVISRKSIEKVITMNTIYYRNSNKRIESAPISNSTDLRELVELAAIRLMQKRKDFGYILSSVVEQGLNQELQTIGSNPTLEKIKSNGYWSIIFQPVKNENISLILDIRTALEKAQVKKDWDFPVIPRDHNDRARIMNGSDFYGAASDYGRRKEYWKFFKSGQFVFYSALTEDWWADDHLLKNHAGNLHAGMYVTMFSSIIYQLTAMVDFLARLGSQGMYKDGVRLLITLNNVAERLLYPDSSGRYPFMIPKKNSSPVITLEETYAIEDIVQNSTVVSNKFILQVLDAFGYNPDRTTILQDQNRYLAGLS